MKFALNKSIDILEEVDDLIFANGIEGVKGVAKKGQYVCPYCGVRMLVRAGGERGNYFAHPPNLACIESVRVDQAYRKYKKQKKRESVRHPVLVSMIKDELRTANQNNDEVEVVEGYLLEQFQEYFPDLYVRIGSREWAITVVTELTEMEEQKHAKNFQARHRYFIEKEMEPLWLFDRTNFAKEEDKRSIILWQTEWLGSLENVEDYKWEESIKKYTSKKELFEIYEYITKENREDLRIKSIYYISQENEKNHIQVFRYIDDRIGFPYRGFLIGKTYSVPFAEALQIENESFLLSNSQKEEQIRVSFKNETLALQDVKRKEEKQRKMEERRRERLKERMEKERKDKEAAISKIKEGELYKSLSISSDANQEPINETKLPTALNAISFDEKMLNREFAELFGELNRGKKKNLITIVENKKLKKFNEKLLNQRIDGETYLESIWKKVLLEWMNNNYQESGWTVSISMVTELLKRLEVKFEQQNEKLIGFPVKAWLTAYKKALKKDLKIKSELIIED